MASPHGSRRPLGLLLVALCALLLAGCDAFDFRPSGENFQEVPLPTSGIALDLAAPGDTLWVWGEVELRYGVALQGKRFAAVEAFWGDQSLGVSTDPNRLTFNTRGMGGIGPLRLVAYAHSGTGSLADRMGAEFVVAEVRRTLFIANSVTPVTGITAEPHEGLLRLRWDAYPWGTFQAYHIESIPYSGGSWEYRATLTDRRQPTWSDPTYLGGGVTYRVILQAADRSAASYLSLPPLPPPALAAEHVGGGSVRLDWSPGPFYAAVDRVEVRLARPPDYGRLEATLPGSATTFTHEPGEVFGMVWRYRVYPFSAAGRPRESAMASIALDLRRPVRHVRYLPASGTLVGVSTEAEVGFEAALLRLDPATGEEVARVPVYGGASPFSSPSGSRLFTAEHDRIVERDPLTLAPIREVALRPLLGATTLVEGGWASEDGTVFFTKLEEMTFGGISVARGVVALNVETGAVLGSIPALASLVSVAPGGTHVTVYRDIRPEVFAFDGSSFAFVRALSGEGFFADDGHLAVAGPSAVEVYRFPEMTRLHTFGTSDSAGSMSVDPATGRLAFVEGPLLAPHLRQVDPRTGEQHHRLPVASLHASYTIQNRAVWGGGFYRPLDR